MDAAQADVAVGEEKAILQVAEQMHGEATVTQVALKTELSLDQARDLLDTLAERGYCARIGEDNGATLYRFHDLLRNNEHNL